jgi:hypothetical protein
MRVAHVASIRNELIGKLAELGAFGVTIALGLGLAAVIWPSGMRRSR